MKTAHLILCHRSPEQVIRLIERLRFEGSFFIIHVDKRAESDVHGALRAFAAASTDILLAKPVKCFWGSFGMIQATLNCIDAATRSGIPFDYAMPLSGQDYPIKSAAEIHQLLEENGSAEFIAFRLDLPNRWTDFGGAYQALNLVMYFTLFLNSHTYHLKLPRTFPRGWSPHGGSQWWCLTKDYVVYVQNILRRDRSLLRFFRHVYIPDENMFQSIVANSPFAGRIYGSDLRYIDWKNPNPNYPRTLTESDLDKITSSGCLIGRKVDIFQSTELMDRLDELIKHPVNSEPCLHR